MISIGVGSTSGVSAEEVLAAIDTVLPPTTQQVRLGTVAARAAEPGLLAAARQRGWPLVAHPAATLAAVEVPSPSADVARLAGTPSVAEAAALVDGGRLLVDKTVVGRVTVAVAEWTEA